MSRSQWRVALSALLLSGCSNGAPAAPAPAASEPPVVPSPLRAVVGEPAPTGVPPAAVASVSPAPVAEPLGTFVPRHDLLAFVSDRGTSGCGFDIYLYDATTRTVWAPPGANTPGDEFNPSLSHDNQWLVYATDAPGNFDVWLYDLRTGLVNDLPTLNTDEDDASPTLDGEGTRIAYTSGEDLHVFDLRTGANYVPAAVARLGTPIFNPCITADGKAIAFCTPTPHMGLDILIYDVTSATVRRPPFVNTRFDEDEPVPSPVDQRLVFSTNRSGNQDVMQVDLASGYLDRLPLANSTADELTPAYLGAAADRIVFVSDRAGGEDRRLLIYDLASALLDTLPVSHEHGRRDTFSAP